MRYAFCLSLVLLLLSPGIATSKTDGASDPISPASQGPPLAPTRPVINTYWGTPIEDDFQYMENFRDPDVLDWARGQQAYTESWIATVPHADDIADRVVTLTHSPSPYYYYLTHRNGHIFAMKMQPPIQQSFLVMLTSMDDPSSEQVVVDPNTLDPSHSTAIDFYVPSPDASQVAVSLSRNGTEDGTLYVFDVETGEVLPDSIPRVNGGTAGGDVAWTADGTGLYYSRYPYPGERPEEDLKFYQQIWFHQLGTPITDDHYELGESFSRIAEIEFETSADHQHIVASVSYGDGGEYEYWLLSPGRDWTRVARFEDKAIHAEFGPDGLYLKSRAGAPRLKLLRLSLDDPDLTKAEVAVPETDATLNAYAVTPTRVYTVVMDGGPTHLRVYDHEGKELQRVAADEIATVSGLTHAGGETVLFRKESYVEPESWYRLDPTMSAPTLTALRYTSPADFSDCEVTREMAVADDGAEIPITIIKKKDTPVDGTAPTVLYGYGCYGISMKPGFTSHRRLWVEQGGIWAIAHVRGGGEYGDAWHRAANLERKKRTVDDFAACARYLVRAGYTSRERLAVEGGSAGGLLVYSLLALYPQTVGAVVSHVGLSDMLRVELSANGEFNTTEFGTVTDEAQFRGLLAYSPYHNLKPGTAYPSLLSLTGVNDPRVEAWQPFKMTARMQAMGGPAPVLLRVSMDTGHGRGTTLSERDRQKADVYAFLFKALGVEYRPELADGRAD